MMKKVLLLILLIFASSCSPDYDLIPSDLPSWAPSYTPENWNLTSIQKTTDYEYILYYTDSDGNQIEIVLGDNINSTKEDVCKIFQAYRKSRFEVLTNCEKRDNLLIFEVYDPKEKKYFQDAFADRYIVTYGSNVKADTNELIKMVKSME